MGEKKMKIPVRNPYVKVEVRWMLASYKEATAAYTYRGMRRHGNSVNHGDVMTQVSCPRET